MKKHKYALTSNQGTACDETCLCSQHFTKENKEQIEERMINRSVDSPTKGSWIRVDDNEVCECVMC